MITRKRRMNLAFAFLVVSMAFISMSINFAFTTGIHSRNNAGIDDEVALKASDITPSSFSFNNPWYHLWSKAGNDYAVAVGKDSAGNLYMAGRSSGEDFISKYNTTHDVVWNVTRVTADSSIISNMAVDQGGNSYVVGYVNYGGGITSAYLAKYDSYGISQWNRTWHGLSMNTGYGVAVDGLGNIYITGESTEDGGSADAFIAKYSSAGACTRNWTWNKGNFDTGKAIGVDSSGNMYITGSTSGYGGDAFIAKYNAAGTSVWNRTCEMSNGLDEGNAIAFDAGGDVYVAGTMYTVSGSIDAFIVKYSSSGGLQWNHTWGGPETAMDDKGYGVCTDATSVYLAGLTCMDAPGQSDAFIRKYDLNGNLVCMTSWGGDNDDHAYSIISDGTGGVYIAGYTEGFGTSILPQAFLARFIVSEDQGPGPGPGPGPDTFPVEYVVIIVAAVGAIVAVVAFVFVKHRAKSNKNR